MPEGYSTCPSCGERRLPLIALGSRATAVACLNCGEVVERAELEQIPPLWLLGAF